MVWDGQLRWSVVSVPPPKVRLIVSFHTLKSTTSSRKQIFEATKHLPESTLLPPKQHRRIHASNKST
jgi:hypothetical protein